MIMRCGDVLRIEEGENPCKGFGGKKSEVKRTFGKPRHR
jgi:hypothetical protein